MLPGGPARTSAKVCVCASLPILLKRCNEIHPIDTNACRVFLASLLLAEPGRSAEHSRLPNRKSSGLSRRTGSDPKPTSLSTSLGYG